MDGIIVGNEPDIPQEDFDRILIEIVAELSADSIVQIPGIYEVLAEHFNNDVLDAWDEEKEIDKDWDAMQGKVSNEP